MDENPAGQSVEEMMDRLKKRFKAAGLQTKNNDSLSDLNVVGDETRCVTQLRTYVKLCNTMGATFVINEKAQHEIFEAIKTHKNSPVVLGLCMTCLNLLLQVVQKDNRKGKQLTFEIYDGACFNLIKVVPPHLGDFTVSEQFLQFIISLFTAEAVAFDLAGKKTHKLKSIADETCKHHPGVVNLANQIKNLLEKYKEPGLNGNAPAILRSSTLDEFQLLAQGDLLGGDDFDLVSPGGTGGNTGGFGDFGGPTGNDASPKRQEVGKPAQGYVPQAELDEARRTIMQYQIDIQALGGQLNQMQLEHQADKEVHLQTMSRLQEAETNYRREKIESQQKIGTLEQVNQSQKDEIKKLKEEQTKKDAIIASKNNDFEQMKIMVSNQLDQARAHFMSLQNEYKNVKQLNSTLQETAKSARTRVETLEQQIRARNQENEVLQHDLTQWQNKCEEAQIALVNLQTKDNKTQHDANEAYTRLQEAHGKLVNQHQNLYQLNETLKQQFVNLKMEYNQLQQKSNSNLEVFKLQAKIKNLEKEKSELLNMTEVLLSQHGN